MNAVIAARGSGAVFDLGPEMIGRGLALPPRAVVVAKIAEIEAALDPIVRGEISAALRRLMGMKTAGTIADPDMFSKNLMSGVAEFPRDVVARAVSEAVNTLTFCPGAAEFRQIALALVEPMRRQLRTAQRVLEEIDRRDREGREDERRRAERQAHPLPSSPNATPRLAPELPQSVDQLAVQHLMRLDRRSEIVALYLGLMNNDPQARATAEELAEGERNARRTSR